MARPPTLREYLDDAMRLAHKDAVQIEHETGVPAHWTRQFKAGRMKGQLDPERVKLVVDALHADETEVWTYLGRMDRVAALRRGAADEPPASTDSIVEAVRLQTEALVALVEVQQETNRLLVTRIDRLEQLVARLAPLPTPPSDAARAVMDQWGLDAQASMPSRPPAPDPATPAGDG